MKKLLDPEFWARALRSPIVWLGLAVDLLPIFAVLAWGWNATPLVLLYWCENIIAGVMTLPRIFISGARLGAIGVALGLFMCVFFVFHYGLFCSVHGAFLMVFVGLSQGSVNADVMGDITGMIPSIFNFALQSAPNVWIVVAAIAGFQVVVFFWEFIIKAGWKDTNPMAEMFAPYSRIVVMHIGIFAGAAALFLLGQPMVGVLALILLRAAWGVLNNGKANDPFDVSASPGADNAFAEFEKQIEEARARKGSDKR